MYNKYGYYYGYPRCNRNNTVVDDELISLDKAVEGLLNSIKNEKEDEFFYTNLIEMAPEYAKDTISSIRDDETRHNEILRFVYSNITGEVAKNSDENVQIQEMTYAEGLEKAFFDEIAAVKKYRRIMGAMPNTKLHTLLMSIMTDELRHASLYNYLIHKNH